MQTSLKGLYGNWPQEGEIDIMEWVYNLANQFYSSLHWKGSNDFHTAFTGISQSTLASQWLTYGVEMSAVAGDEYLQFFLVMPDGTPRYAPKTPATTLDQLLDAQQRLRSSRLRPHHLHIHSPPSTIRWSTPSLSLATHCRTQVRLCRFILNLAVGGNWGGRYVRDYSAFNSGVTLAVKTIKVFHN